MFDIIFEAAEELMYFGVLKGTRAPSQYDQQKQACFQILWAIFSSSMNTSTGSIGHELTHLAARSFWEVLFHVRPFHTPISRSFPRGSAEPRASPCMEILPAWNSPVQGNKTLFNGRNFHQGPDRKSVV